jgi:hypothetical protein
MNESMLDGYPLLSTPNYDTNNSKHFIYNIYHMSDLIVITYTNSFNL